MHIAYCTHGDTFRADKLRDRQVSYLYPGSGWITVLYQIAARVGIQVASADVALENVLKGRWSAKDILVFQDMDSPQSLPLLQAGATPFIIMCGESPLYAPFFHDKIESISKKFRFCYGFGLDGIKGISEDKGRLKKFRFPSFYQEDLVATGCQVKWSLRRRVALVAANKYKSPKIFYPKGAGLVGVLRQIKWMGWRMTSPSYNSALMACLHESRLEAITCLARHGEVHLYGSDWGDLRGLPLSWAKQLASDAAVIDHGRCESKLQVLQEHQFSICYENIAMPGYITEKIIDCFVAGVVPIYLGAPDIEDFIPADAFISALKLDLETIAKRMSSMDADEGQHMIDAGRQYLRSEQGVLHSYEGFAAAVLQLVQQC